MSLSTNQSKSFIEAMLDAHVYNHPIDKIELIETHISWVILTGKYAYKIKKPVNLGFLDFSSLDKRKYCCEEELRLNRRTAAEIYLEVVSITGSIERPELNSDGEIIEYAVKMHQFPQACQLDRILQRNELNTEKVDAFSLFISRFHQSVKIADKSSDYGCATQLNLPVQENLHQIRERMEDVKRHKILEELSHWVEDKYLSLQSVFEDRKQQGFVRECHGDLHLRNMAWIDNKPLAFDCIEFNPQLRWIDVISDVAFLVMDLQFRNQAGLAQRFLNAYLQITGDYSGVQVLLYYLMYRALVRAKVAAINLQQTHTTNFNRESVQRECYDYVNLAASYSQKLPARLIITHGVSASGKTTFTQDLLQYLSVIRVRSDVERKRLANLNPENPVDEKTKQEIYTKQFSDRVYNKLTQLAGIILQSGYSVIIDAAFLSKYRREQFRMVAKATGVELVILSFSVPNEILRQRIMQRTNDASDADILVLESQLNNFRPLDKSEKKNTYFINEGVTAKKIASMLEN